ncbi:MAG: LysR family transcriptional regulator [Proteobacteria bacterium]|nr:LysR family transcriptional regulator [Pseudomonadota bacterium]
MDSLGAMRVFSRVVEMGSFSAAGRQLGSAPSSVSRRVGELEDQLGVQLFQRTTRRLSLTDAGRLYHERVRRILLEVDEAKLAVAQMEAVPSGILRITVPASVARLHSAPALAEFHRHYPAVQVALAVTDRVVDLIDGGYDLAIRVGRLKDSSLIVRKIGASRRLVCASPSYLKAAGTPRTPSELSEHNCLTFRSTPGKNLWRFRGAEGSVEVRVSGSLFADSGEVLSALAFANLGIVLVPNWLVGIHIREGRLRELLTDYEVLPEGTPLYAVYPRQRHIAPKVRAFIDFLVKRFAPPYAWDERH